MLEVRYNGCADCLTTVKGILRKVNMYVGRDYTVAYHKEHSDDKIYSVRPDYIKVFSGAIIYNPDRQAWIDVYDDEHMKCVLCDLTTDELKASII